MYASKCQELDQKKVLTADSPRRAQACLPEDKAILNGALHCGVAPGVPVELVGGKLVVALQVHHLQAAIGGMRKGSWISRGLSLLCRFSKCRLPHTEVSAAYDGSVEAALNTAVRG